MEPVLSLAMAALWAATLVQDLKRREIAAWVLAALTVLSLAGRAWPWWAVAGLVVLWPTRERILILLPVIVSAGLTTGDPVPSVAIATGVVAWALGWWGGADGIALTALVLRGGLAGLVAGALATAVVGLALMAARGCSWTTLWTAVPDVLSLSARRRGARDLLIPSEAEMPAAAALAVAGLAMEVLEICRIVKIV